MDVGGGPGAYEHTLRAQAQAEATWGARGFQGASGGAPCVLTTVTTPAHSDATLGPSQTKEPPNQHACSEDGREVSFQTQTVDVKSSSARGTQTPSCVELSPQ